MGEAPLPSVMQGSGLLPPYGSAKCWGKIARGEVEVFMAMPGGFTSLSFISIGQNLQSWLYEGRMKN